MNIGETSATLPVIDALAGTAGAAPVGGAAGFADKLAEAMAPKAAVPAAMPEGGAAAIAAAPAANVSPSATVPPSATPPAQMPVAEALAVHATKPVKAGGVAELATDADLAAVLTVPLEGVAKPCGPAAIDGVAPDAMGLVAESGAGADEDAAEATPELDAEAEGLVLAETIAPLPPVAVVALPAALPAAHAAVEGAKGDGAVARSQRDAVPRAGAFAVSVTVEAGFALSGVTQVADGAKPGVVDRAGLAEGEAPVAGDEKPAGQKALPSVLAPEPVVARSVEAVAASLPAGPKPVVVEDAPADPAGPLMQQAPQALPQAAERLAAQPLQTDVAGWEQVLSERIAAELSDDGQQIELSLAPEKLGPLRIKLEMVDGLAQVRIITATPEAARVFTDAQHRLTEGLARAGIDLGSQSAQSGQQGRQAEDRSAPRNRMTEFLTHSRRIEAGDAPALRRTAAGLVNLMA